MEDGHFHKFEAGGLEFSVEALERLELVASLRRAPNPFTVGDLVKLRPFAPLQNIKGACVVLEIVEPPIRHRPHGGMVEGYLFDLRVGIACGQGHIHSCLAESWMFETFAGLLMFGATATTPPPKAGPV